MRRARPTRVMPAHVLPLVGAIALGAALSGCGDDTAPSADTAPATSAASSPASAVPAALDFTAPLVGGGQLDAGSLADQPVLFWFWAPY